MARGSCGRESRMERRNMRVGAAAARRQNGSRLKQRKRLLQTRAACLFAAMMAENTQCPAQGGAMEGVDGSSARQTAERRQQAAP